MKSVRSQIRQHSFKCRLDDSSSRSKEEEVKEGWVDCSQKFSVGGGTWEGGEEGASQSL